MTIPWRHRLKYQHLKSVSLLTGILNYSRRLLLLQIAIALFGLLLTSEPSSAQSFQKSKMQLAITQDSPVAPYQLQVDKLLQLIKQRLIIQHEVARWKWNHKRAIEAPQREQELLKQLRQQAATYNLSPDAVSAFFQWQIHAGKLIQIADFQDWQKRGIQSIDNVPDLNLTLRPLLDKLDAELLSTFVEIMPVLGCSTTQELIQSHAERILRGDGIDQTVRRVALAPLLEANGTSCQSASSFSPTAQVRDDRQGVGG